MKTLGQLALSLTCLIGTVTSLFATEKEWSRFRGPNADGVWNPKNIPHLRELQKSEPVQKWQQTIGAGYAGVTIANGKAYVMDYHKSPKEIERTLCFNVADGKLLWSHSWEVNYDGLAYGSGPRASVTLHEGKAYAIGALGHLFCFNAENGKVLWTQDTRETLGAKPPQWGFAASPLIHQNLVILHLGAEPEGTVLALHRDTGKEVWRTGKDAAGYSTPMIFPVNGKEALVQWTPEHVFALDPLTGKLHWSFPYSIRYGVSIAQPIYHENILLVSSYWHGTRALTWNQPDQEPTLLWSTEDKLQGLMSQPLYRDGVVYLLDRNEGICAFELKTGKYLWNDEHLLTPKDRNPQISLVWVNQKEGILGGLNAMGEWVLAKVSKEGIEEIARHQVSGKTWAHPAFTPQGLIVRTDNLISHWDLW